MEWATNPEIWISLLTLTILEVVLGIDNIIFISILSGKLPAHQQQKARQLGLGLALVTRIILLFGIAWVAKLNEPFWKATIFGKAVSLSWRDVVLIVGGLFLLAKSTYEIHEKLEGDDGEKTVRVIPNYVPVMIAAVIIAMGVMFAFVNQISNFVDRHPTIKMLALAFLILIGSMLVAEGFHQHIPKGYIYFAMAFAVGVEMLNTRIRSKPSKPVTLHQPYR